MTLRLITGLSVQRRSKRSNDQTARCTLSGPGVPPDMDIEGAILEAAVQTDVGLVLFLTQDLPYEDSLSIQLFNAAWQVLDSASLGAAYTTGSFTGVRVIEPDRIGFRFFGDTEWTLRILNSPTWRLPLWSDAPGVRHTFGFKRHFLIQGRPQRGGA